MNASATYPADYLATYGPASAQVPLDEAQAELDGYLFGAGTATVIEQIAVDAPAAATQDTPMILADGQAFGVDALAGRTVTFTGHVTGTGDPAAMFDTYAALEAAWAATATRLTPRAVSVLRLRYPGTGPTWRVYGRARSIAPTLYPKGINLVQFVAAFTTAGPLFYDDAESQLHLSLLSADRTSGIVTPVTLPVTLATDPAAVADTAVNAGKVATWPVITFTGPVTNPSLTYVETGQSVGLTGSLAAGLAVTVDTRPWARSVTDPDGGSYAGRLTGSRIADLGLPPGTTTVAFRGQDSTGSASCVFAWRRAAAMIGGS
jgi:hypothetical protein